MKVEFEGTIHDFPDDFTDAEVSKALASFGKSAMTPASPKPSASSGGLLDKLKAIVGEGANAMMAESEMMASPSVLPAVVANAGGLLSAPVAGLVGLGSMAFPGNDRLGRANRIVEGISSFVPGLVLNGEQDAATAGLLGEVLGLVPKKAGEGLGMIADLYSDAMKSTLKKQVEVAKSEGKPLSEEQIRLNERFAEAMNPIAQTIGEFSSLALFSPKSVAGLATGIKRAVTESNWFRKMTIPERGLVVQSLDDMINRGYSEGEILRRWNSPQWRAEALQRRAQGEKASEASAPSPETGFSMSNPIVAEAILKAKQERALPGPEGLDMGNVPDFQLTPSRGMADLIIEATRKRLEGKGMPLLPEPEPGPPSSPYSPELAELIRNIQEKKALPPGQGFTMPDTAARKEDLVLRKGEPSWTAGKIPDSVDVEYRPRLSKSGAPFKTEKTAQAAINKMGLQDEFVPVGVNGGWGMKRAGTKSPTAAPEIIEEASTAAIGQVSEGGTGASGEPGRNLGKAPQPPAIEQPAAPPPLKSEPFNGYHRLLDIENNLGIYSNRSIPDAVKRDATKLIEAIKTNDQDTISKIAVKYQSELSKGDVTGGPKEVKAGDSVKKDVAHIALREGDRLRQERPASTQRELPGNQSQTLYSGFDPIAAVKAVRALGDDIAKAIPHLEALGRSVFDSGKRTAKDWVASMKSFLGDLWAKFREQLRDIWNNLKAMDRSKGPMGSERGSLKKEKGNDIIPAMSKTPGKADIPAKTTPQAEAGYLKIKGKDTIGRDIPDWRDATVYHSTSKAGFADISEKGYRILGAEAEDGQGGYYGEAVSFTPTKTYAEQFGDVLTKAKLSKDVKILNLNDEKDWAIYQKITGTHPDLGKLREQITKAGYDGVYDAGAGDLFLYNPEKAKLLPNPSRPPEGGGQSGPILYSGVDITKIPEVLRHIRSNLKDFRPVLRERDVTLLQRIWQSPHWEAKKHPEFKAIYDREMKREQDRAKMFDARLKGWESARNLSEKDLDKLRKVIWITEGRKFKSVTEPRFVWEDNPYGRTGANGDVLKSVKGLNLKHYRQIGDYLRERGVPKNVIDAYVDIRKHYDKSYAMIFNKMVEMKDVDADTITQYRQEIGNISNYFPHQWYGNYHFHGLDKDGNVLVRIQYNDMAPGGFSVRHKGKLAQAKKDYPYVAEWTPPKKSRQMPEEVYEYPIPVEAMEQIISAAADRVKGVDPAAAEAFLGAMPEAVADVIKSRGFGGHMIRRKGVEGYEKQDILRVMYDFDSSFSGWLTKMEAARDFSALMRDIDARKRPGLYAYTSRYVKDVLSNADRVDRIVDGARAFFFLNFLGGNLKSGVVNGLTQNIITGIPRLSMDAGYHAVKYFKAAGDDVVAGVTKDRNLKPDEAKALDELYREGVIADQYAQEIKGQVYGRGASVLNGLNNVAGIFMSVSEKFNRASLALAAFRLAREGKISGKRALEKYGLEKGQKATYEQAIAFATDVTLDAHFSYGKGNLPEFLRGRTKILRPAYSLSSFSHNLMQLWAHMLRNGGRGAAAFAMSMMGTALFGGMMSVPFIKPIFEAWRRTFGTDPQKEIRKKLPEAVRDVVTYGTPAAMGVNIGGSLEIGNVDSSNPMKWIIGVPYSVVDSIGRSKRAYESGQTDRALEEVMPTVAKNPMAAWRLYDKGQHSVSGQPINLPGETGPRKITAWEAVAKSFGFQPLSSTKARDAYEAMEDLKSFVERKQSKWANSYANAYHRDDLKEMSRIQEEVSAWNDRWMKQDKPEFTINLRDAVKRRMKPEQPPRKFRGLGLQYAEEYS